MALYRLIYSSRALSSITYPDLKQIWASSEKNNPAVGLTGMLCFGNGLFLQVLEGDRGAVNHTYHRIVKDERHYNPEIIEYCRVDHRHFGIWSMKSVQLNSNLTAAECQVLLKHHTVPVFEPEKMDAAQCLGVMLDLAAIA
ncbi:MAG: BLUF domain-containing protein [Pseudanabaenaceae cyanobacterium bins.68]|nr:BLUF domain-containing protein [Pseudanabaenaceae cyanobacterium bins.68]